MNQVPQIIDISLPLKEGVPIWPGSTGIHLHWNLRTEKGDPSNLTRLDTDVHIGTHLESALHSFADSATVDTIPLELLIGPVTVVSLTGLKIINAQALEPANIPSSATRVILKTDNSSGWTNNPSEFNQDFVGLSADGAQWLVDHHISLVGNDYLSVASFKEGPMVHEILLKNNVAIIEGLNLSQVEPGEYELICLPLKLEGREGAPARAVLIK